MHTALSNAFSLLWPSLRTLLRFQSRIVLHQLVISCDNSHEVSSSGGTLHLKLIRDSQPKRAAVTEEASQCISRSAFATQFPWPRSR